MAVSGRLSVARVEEALRQSAGVQALAAAKLGCHRNTIRNKILKHARLRAVVEEIVDETLDLAESQLLQGIKNGDKTFIIFYLKTKGKHRGYVERQEQTGAGGGPVQQQWVIEAPPMAESEEAWEAENRPTD